MFDVGQQIWPPVPGEYFVICDDKDLSCPVAASTLADEALAERLAELKPKGMCIVGKTETENIGIDKIIVNTITNPRIRFLLLLGEDAKGHCPGKTILALSQNGVDENMKVIGSSGKLPILKNVTTADIDNFRKQVLVMDMIGCTDIDTIIKKINDLSVECSGSCNCNDYVPSVGKPIQGFTAPVIEAKVPSKVEMDKAGYFVIIPQEKKGIVRVEHYSYDNKLSRIIEGLNARDIYYTIIENGWITQLSHACYLGKELEKAELSMKLGFKYIQDGA